MNNILTQYLLSFLQDKENKVIDEYLLSFYKESFNTIIESFIKNNISISQEEI